MRTTWPEVALGDVCTLNYGRALPASARSGYGSPVFGSNGPVGQHANSLTSGPTIIVGRKGSFGEVHYSPTGCWPIDTTYYVDEDSSSVDLRWLYYRLDSLGLTEMNRAAAIPGLNREDAYRKRFLLPPMPEQRRIAAILDQADALRRKRRAAQAQASSIPPALFIGMFGDPMRNPQKFPVRPLIEIVDPSRPITYGILKPGPNQVAGVKYVRVVDMKDGGIDSSDIRRTTTAISNAYRRSLLQTGDLLMSIRGHVGRVAMVPPELNEANITQDTARLAILGLSPIFVRECLRTSSLQHWMGRHTKGVAVQGVNLTDVKKIPIIVPPVASQRIFEERLNMMQPTFELTARSRAMLDDLFLSLQHRAFRAEL